MPGMAGAGRSISARRFVRRRKMSQRGSGGWQGYPDRCAAAGSALDSQASPVILGDSTGDGQTEARPAVRRCLAAPELLQHLGEFGRVDPDAGVLDLDD